MLMLDCRHLQSKKRVEAFGECRSCKFRNVDLLVSERVRSYSHFIKVDAVIIFHVDIYMKPIFIFLFLFACTLFRGTCGAMCVTVKYTLCCSAVMLAITPRSSLISCCSLSFCSLILVIFSSTFFSNSRSLTAPPHCTFV